MENTATRFILCGSSARKLRRRSHNLLGGRAVDFHLFPLTPSEIGQFDLPRALRHGLLPPYYLADHPTGLLQAYVNNYIKAEIIDESVTRNIPAFACFMQVIGLSHGEQINYAGVS